MIWIASTPFLFVLLKAAFFALPVALVPLLFRSMVAWRHDPWGAESDPAILGWGLGAVLTPTLLLLIAVSDLGARTQCVLAVVCVAFIFLCVCKVAGRMRFHGLL